MSPLFNLFHRGQKDGGARQPLTAVTERDLLRDLPESPPEQLSYDVKELLDRLLQQFPSELRVTAEALIPSRDSSQLITEEIRPNNAPLLHARIRAGQSLSWRVFTTKAPIVREEIAMQSGATTAPDAPPVETRCITTRSAVCYPILRNDACLGVLNLESAQPGAFSTQLLTQLAQSTLIAELATELAKIQLDDLTDQQIAQSLTERMSERLPHIISPADMAETYYQILSVAASVVHPTTASAGLILGYNQSQELTTTTQNEEIYAVRAARFGAFNSDLEWDLENDASASRDIIREKLGKFIPDSELYSGNRATRTGIEHTGEVIVPLMESPQDDVAGVIGLVAPVHDNFAGQEDVDRVQAVARYAVSAIRNSEQYKLGRRRAEQQLCARELQNMLAPLFPREGGALTGDTIARVRIDIGKRLLEWATYYTRSEHGAFVLIQTTPTQDGSRTELVMTDWRTNGAINPNIPSRWQPGEGVSGRAFAEQRTIPEKDVLSSHQSDSKKYIPYFIKARSEVATPLRIGDTVLGVLDVESDEVNHFTSDYIDWIEFLGRQAAFALSVVDRASKTLLELKMSELSRTVDKGIEDIRAQTLPSSGKPPEERIAIIRTMRNELIKTIVETMRGLSGAWVGRFLIELNAYGRDDEIDLRHGRLSYLYSSDEAELNDREHRFFRLTKGVSSAALRDQKLKVFNDLKMRETEEFEGYFDSNPERRGSQSGIFVPTLEATHVSGVLNLECQQAGAFTPEMIRACESAGDLLSKLLTGTRLRVAAVLREMLRAFELEIAREQTSQLTPFMDRALDRAARLSGIEEGWGILIQLQPGAVGEAPRVERWRTRQLGPQARALADGAAGAELLYPVFLNVIDKKEPLLILDRLEADQDAEDMAERRHEPWPNEARAVIVVPLISPAEGNSNSQVVGLLALAHPSAAEFSEYDKESLTLLAESIVSSFRTIALKQARAQLVEQLRVYLAKTIVPAALDAGTADDALEKAYAEAQRADNHEQARKIAEARELIPHVLAVLGLTSDLTSWFLDLADDELKPDDDEPSLQTAQSVLETFKEPANRWAAIFGRTIAWQIPAAPTMNLASNKAIARLVSAALFEFIDAALRISDEQEQIEVGVSASGAQAIFWVRCGGEPLTESQQRTLFVVHVVGASQNSASGSTSRALQGMFQVEQIAQRLGGRAYPQVDPTPNAPLPNRFYLAVPQTAS